MIFDGVIFKKAFGEPGRSQTDGLEIYGLEEGVLIRVPKTQSWRKAESIARANA